jgi:hypothetical protein
VYKILLTISPYNSREIRIKGHRGDNRTDFVNCDGSDFQILLADKNYEPGCQKLVTKAPIVKGRPMEGKNKKSDHKKVIAEKWGSERQIR